VRLLRCRCGWGPLYLDPVNVGRCANFAGSGLIAVLPFSEASDYGTDSGLYLYTDLVDHPSAYPVSRMRGTPTVRSELQEMRSVVFQLIDRFMHVSQRSMLLLLFKTRVHLGSPASAELF
jgi:hypothetical protein